MTSRPSIRGFQSSPNAASSTTRGSSDIARELACLHHICETHLQELDVIGTQGGGSNKLRKLIAMTDMLCGHKKHYMQQQQQLQQAGTLMQAPQHQPERMVWIRLAEEDFGVYFGKTTNIWSKMLASIRCRERGICSSPLWTWYWKIR